MNELNPAVGKMVLQVLRSVNYHCSKWMERCWRKVPLYSDTSAESSVGSSSRWTLSIFWFKRSLLVLEASHFQRILNKAGKLDCAVISRFSFNIECIQKEEKSKSSFWLVQLFEWSNSIFLYSSPFFAYNVIGERQWNIKKRKRIFCWVT